MRVSLPLLIPEQGSLKPLKALTPPSLCSRGQHHYECVNAPGVTCRCVQDMKSAADVRRLRGRRLIEKLNEHAFLKRAVRDVGSKRLLGHDRFVRFGGIDLGKVRKRLPAFEHELELAVRVRSEEHTSELQSLAYLV